MSNLTKTLAVVSLLAPASAQPLGIGNIELHSALNQNLNAEINLHLDPGENPSDISVRLAPPQKFDQAGIPWSYFLSKIKFQTVTQANGNVVVKVTSREELTEPFLDFLLEVSWPQGSQFREFTLLIDPPAEYSPPAIPSTGTPFQAQVIEEYDRPVRKSRSSTKRRVRTETESGITPQTPSSGDYGPVQRADSLWRIADQLGKERNVPVKQMMNALFQANPHAFNNGSMDALKTGVVLRIPETEAILKRPVSQTAEQKPAVKESVPAAKPATPSKKPLELVAPTESKIAENATASGPSSGTEQADGASATVTGETATGGKDLELQSRIEKLEQQLTMMQQLLALKDQQLATLQNKDSATKPPVPAQPAPTVQQPQPSPEQPAPVPKPSETTQVPPAAQQPPAATQQPQVTPEPPKKPKPPKAPKPLPPPAVEENGLLYYTTIGGLGGGVLALLGWLWWRKRKIEEQTNTESMFASASQIKMPDADSTLSVPMMEMATAGSYDVGTVGESSFISDFTPSDFDAFDTDQNEVDPLSEADVYLAYGRYQQAEELIRNAIREQPDKDEYKLKLLEILYANESGDKFAAYAQELADDGKQADRPFWAKVSEMAKEIIPESVLFGGAGTTAAHSESANFTETPQQNKTNTVADFSTAYESADDDQLLNDDLIDLNAPTLPDMALMNDINSELAEMQLTSERELETTDNTSLDFDLSSFSDAGSPPKVDDSDSADIETIDFDLTSLSLDNAAPEKTVDDKTAEDTLESFDFNFDIDHKEASITAEKSDSASDLNLDEPLDMADLESFEFPSFEETEAEAKPGDTVEITPVKAEPEESNEFDFNFDFEVPDEATKDSGSMDFGVSDLTDMDELETKIDLAKAYIDMGDIETAQTIAEEVLQKGNKEQQAAAQAILDELRS